MATFYITKYFSKPLIINVDAIDTIESVKNGVVIKTRSSETYALNIAPEDIVKELSYYVKFCGLGKLNKNIGECDADDNNG